MLYKLPNPIVLQTHGLRAGGGSVKKSFGFLEVSYYTFTLSLFKLRCYHLTKKEEFKILPYVWAFYGSTTKGTNYVHLLSLHM